MPAGLQPPRSGGLGNQGPRDATRARPAPRRTPPPHTAGRDRRQLYPHPPGPAGETRSDHSGVHPRIRQGLTVASETGRWPVGMLSDRSGGHPVAWLSLDTADNDPIRFWRHAIAALDTVRPGIAGRAGPLLGPPAPPSFDGLVTALINELAAEPAEHGVPLVLDDYHLIDAQPVHASLTFLLEHLPPGLQLVLASRTDPPLPLARLRASEQLTELRASGLRFTPDEAALLIREATGAELPAAAVDVLTARTW